MYVVYVCVDGNLVNTLSMKILQENKEIQYSQKGKHTIFIIGGFGLVKGKNLKVDLIEKETGKNLNIIYPFLSIRRFINFRRAIEFGTFYIDNPCTVKIEISNIDDLKVYKSGLIISKYLFSKIDYNKIEIHFD